MDNLIFEIWKREDAIKKKMIEAIENFERGSKKVEDLPIEMTFSNLLMRDGVIVDISKKEINVLKKKVKQGIIYSCTYQSSNQAGVCELRNYIITCDLTWMQLSERRGKLYIKYELGVVIVPCYV